MTARENTDSPRTFRFYDVVVALFVAVLITSNIVTTKISMIGPVTFVGGAVLFPFAYIFGDVLTEIYGYARTRRAIWIGCAGLIFLSLSLLLVEYLPAAPFWHGQASYQAILGFVPRIVLASICGYLVGEFVNAAVMAKLKVRTNAKHLWMRTIGSTVLGEAADTIVFNTVAFIGVLAAPALIKLALTAYCIKVFIEIVCTPLTYVVIGWLKRREGSDPFDTHTNLNPFAVSK